MLLPPDLRPSWSYIGRRTPHSEGVHYSDLFEEYLPVADKPRRLLADWLPEYFVKTLSGTWRPPNDDGASTSPSFGRQEPFGGLSDSPTL